jgi:DNA-directed RNA polymerase specialized sigma24 family protein
MTIKQTESMLLYYYENHSLAKCSEILGITYWNLNRRIKGAYLRIKYALGKVKKGKKRIKYRERVYKIVEIKI